MNIRLVVSINAAPGKGAELAQAFRQRCADVANEPGCEQFEVFQTPGLRAEGSSREDYQYNLTR